MAIIQIKETGEVFDLNLFDQNGREVAAEYLDRYGYTYSNYVYHLTKREFEWWEKTFAMLNKLFAAYASYEYCHGKRALKRKIARVKRNITEFDLQSWATAMLDAFADYV